MVALFCTNYAFSKGKHLTCFYCHFRKQETSELNTEYDTERGDKIDDFTNMRKTDEKIITQDEMQFEDQNAERSVGNEERKIEIESKNLQTEIKNAKRKVPVPNVPVNPEDLYSKVIRKKSVETDVSGKSKHESVTVSRKESNEESNSSNGLTRPRNASEERVKDIPAAVLLRDKEDLYSKIIQRRPVDDINFAVGTDKSVIKETEKGKPDLEKADEENVAIVSKDSDTMKEVFEMYL